MCLPNNIQILFCELLKNPKLHSALFLQLIEQPSILEVLVNPISINRLEGILEPVAENKIIENDKQKPIALILKNLTTIDDKLINEDSNIVIDNTDSEYLPSRDSLPRFSRISQFDKDSSDLNSLQGDDSPNRNVVVL